MERQHRVAAAVFSSAFGLFSVALIGLQGAMFPSNEFRSADGVELGLFLTAVACLVVSAGLAALTGPLFRR